MTDTAVDGPPAADASAVAGGLPPRFGRYTILNQLGRGAMGVVYLARDDELDRLVAIKVPLFGRFSEEAVFQRFQREVRAAAGLRHPHICPVYDVGQIDGTIYMTMAYIAGRPLTDFIASGKQFSLRQRVLLVRKLASAVHEAHRRGVVHRDLKPANIMIDQRGEPLVMDFGLARRERADDLRITLSGAMVGTPAYMSPEQLAGQADGPAGDVYSLGVVLYELLAGRLPFEGDLVQLVAQVARDQPQPPSQHQSDVPPELDEICLKALAKEPGQRYASMAALAEALTAFLADASAAPRPPERTAGPGPAGRAAWRAAVGYHALAAAGGLLLAGLAVMLIGLWAGRGDRREGPGELRVSAAASDDGRSGAAAADASGGQPPGTGPATSPPQAAAAPAAGETAAEEDDLSFIVGRNLCFIQRDWDHGLRLLAGRGKNPLSDLAARDLALQQQPLEASVAAALEVADGWRELAVGESHRHTALAMQQRAATWYRQVVDQLDDAERQRVRQWLAGVDQAAAEPAGVAAPAVAAATGAADTTARDGELAASDAGAATPPASPPAAAVATTDTADAGDPASHAGHPPDAAASPRDAFFQESLARLQEIDARREKMIAEMRQVVVRCELELPDAYVKATSAAAELQRRSKELAAEIEEDEAAIRVINSRSRAAPPSPTARRVRDAQIAQIRQLQAARQKELNGLWLEVRGKTQEIARLNDEQATLTKRRGELLVEASRLLEQAFWVAEPTGSFSPAQYHQIGDVFLSWLRDDPTQFEIRALYAIALTNAGDVDAARDAASQASRRNNKSPLVATAMGWVEAHNGRASEGLMHLKRAQRRAQSFAGAYLLRGVVSQRAGRDEEALQDFSRALELRPDAALAESYLALGYAAARDEALRDPAAALEHARLACEATQRKSWQCLAALAAAHAAAGQFDDAVAAQQAALELAPAERQGDGRQRLSQYQAGVAFRFD